MAGDTTLTITGNLCAEPEMRFTPSGKAVVNFTIATTPRSYDKTSGEWKDGDTLFMRCTAWDDLAEHITDSLAKGTRVIATGTLKQRDYETKEKEKRTVIEMTIEEIGPSLKWAVASISKTGRNGNSPSQHHGEADSATSTGGDDDPWAVASTSTGGYDDPPF